MNLVDESMDSSGGDGAVASRMKELRNSLGLTQAEFAERLCVSRKTLSEIENGKKEPGGLLLHGLEYCFGTDRVWILSGKGGMLKRVSPDAVEIGEVACSAEAEELINGFNLLSKEAREKLLKILEAFLLSEDGKGRGSA